MHYMCPCKLYRISLDISKASSKLSGKVVERFRFFRNRDRRGVPSRQEYRLPVSASLQKVIEERKVHAKMWYEKNEVSYTWRRSPTFFLAVFLASIWFSRLRRRKIKPRVHVCVRPSVRVSHVITYMQWNAVISRLNRLESTTIERRDVG